MNENKQQEVDERDVQTLVELTESELDNSFVFSVAPQNCFRNIEVTIEKPQEWAKYLLLNGCPNFDDIVQLSTGSDPIVSYEEESIYWDYCEDEGNISEVLSDIYTFDDFGDKIQKLHYIE